MTPRSLAVLGLGKSGTAVVEWALARRAAGESIEVAAFVEDDGPSTREAATRLVAAGARVETGVSAPSFAGCDLIVASPGIAPHRPLFRAAVASGVPVISEVELAYRIGCARWIAVTGTNGKTTTTALIAHLLRSAGLDAREVGNFGPPAITAAAEATADVVLVAECSSFQLAGTSTFRPEVAVVLNITPDHLDWHLTMEEYVAAKSRVFASMGAGDTAVVDVDDPGSAPLADAAAALGVSVVRVGLQRRGPGLAGAVGGTLRVGDTDLVPASELRILGAHNVSNALAASAAALAAGADAASVRAGLRSFEPLAHRLRPVGVVDGVTYVDDSKGTNPDAVLKALDAYAGAGVIVLLGGSNKDSDFGPLAAACATRCRTAVLYGATRDALRAAFDAAGAPYLTAGGMLDALSEAASVARAGDVVLLSPACASFDEFDDYAHRGRVFADAVAAMEGRS